MAVLKFQFDESYDSQIMCAGGWIANENEWKRLESSWQKRIDFENSNSREDQKITRYHATEMNCKSGEFKNWDKAKCLLFSKRLISILSKRKMGAVAVACDMGAISEVFPGSKKAELKENTYSLCVKMLMLNLSFLMTNIFPGDSVLIVHAKGNWDYRALQAYNSLIDEPDFKYRDRFEGILPNYDEFVGLTGR